MPTLILTLPFTPSTTAPEYDYVRTPDGQQVGSQGRAAASMLPAQAGRGTEIVAVVPARALSWHRIALPDKVLRAVLAGRMDAARVRSVLAGVLEEQLLDEAEALHFAVFAASGEGANAWVAVCERHWLHTCLQALEAAGRTVDRICAECTPLANAPARVFLSPDKDPAQMLLCTTQGVSLLPLQDAALQLARAHSNLDVRAEPAVMALAEHHFGPQATLQPRAQRLLEAAQSPWNLAQLECTASTGGRLAKRLGSVWQLFLHAPAWRAARWGLVALVLVQLVGLNALAWQQRRLLETQRSAIQAALTQTFPEVTLVVDAPLQMQRAVDDLARSRGAVAEAELGRMLSTLAPAMPANAVLSSLELNEKQIRLQGPGLAAQPAPDLRAALDNLGLRLHTQDSAWLLEPKEPQ